MHHISALLKRICTIVHLIYIKILHIKSFSFSGISIIGNSTRFTIIDKGRIVLGKNIGIRRNCEIAVSEKGIINFEDNVFLNNGCMIVSHCSISIGAGTRLGPMVMVYDHDYDYTDRIAFESGKHISEAINIGKNCWIGAGAIILKGSQIGNNCVIGAGAVIKGSYKDNSIIVQKRIEEISEIVERKDYYEASFTDCR